MTYNVFYGIILKVKLCGEIMDTVVNKNITNVDMETEEEVNLILERQKEAREGKVMSLDDSIKDFVVKRNAWKSIL